MSILLSRPPRRWRSGISTKAFAWCSPSITKKRSRPLKKPYDWTATRVWRLPQLVPGAGHLVHMPAHIYMRLGQYQKASEHNAQAASLDHQYIESRHPSGDYPMHYYAHNLYFLWASLAMEGRSVDAIDTARNLVSLVSQKKDKIDPTRERFLTTLLLAWSRFSCWREILSEPRPYPDLQYATGIWHYARGLALAATEGMQEAEHEWQAVQEAVKSMPLDRTVGNNSARSVLQIAEQALGGALRAQQGRFDEAVALLKEAARLEDMLDYDEPPDWYHPVRETLGRVLLKADRRSEAEKAYREDLRNHPENGWSLYGLAQSVRAQGRATEAGPVEQRFCHAWARADVPWTRICRAEG